MYIFSLLANERTRTINQQGTLTNKIARVSTISAPRQYLQSNVHICKKKKPQFAIPTSIFRNYPQKGAQGDAVHILSPLKEFLKRIKQKRPLKDHKYMFDGGKTHSTQLPLED